MMTIGWVAHRVHDDGAAEFGQIVGAADRIVVLG